MRPYYQHGGVTIYHGDCREVLPQVRADVLVTDPPYGIGFAAQPTTGQRRAGQRPMAWDSEPFADVDLLLGSTGEQVIWGGNYYSLPLSRGWLVWVKPDAPPSMGSVELAWTSRDRNARHIIHSISATNRERVGHPTQKPLAVMTWTLMHVTPGTVLDPFMGSGTTLRAAKNLGRPSIGIEIEEQYCDLAVKRLEQEVLDFGDVA